MTTEIRKPGEDAAHAIRAERQIDAAAFFREATGILNARAMQVTDEVLPNLEHYPGKWHPLGFMVYPMGIIPEVGILRLHIWPAGLRMARGTGPGIHDHGWHLASKALKRVYFDEIHDLHKVDAPNEKARVAAGGLTSFTVQYEQGKPDGLMPDGDTFVTEISEYRAVPAGDIHTIEAGVFHVSSIPEDRVAATLALDSLALGFSPRVLLNAPAEPIYDNRQVITTEQAEYAKRQLV